MDPGAALLSGSKDAVRLSERPSGPLVSIVTVCRNAAPTIRRTIESVLAQGYKNREYIVVDGGSTDGTLDILKEYANALRWLSEADRGIYDAMNKGIRLAAGDWIHLLNADDWYTDDNALERAIPHLDEHHTMYFDLVRVYPDGSTVLQSRTVQPWMLYVSAFLPHPSLIVSRAQYDAVGLYDTELKIAADHDLILRMVHKYPPKHLPMPLTSMAQGGLSGTDLMKSLDEFTEVTCRHGLPRLIAHAIRRLKGVWWKLRSNV